MKNLLFITCFSVFIGSAQETTKTNTTVTNLISEIYYQEKVNKKVILDGETYKMILFAMKKRTSVKAALCTHEYTFVSFGRKSKNHYWV